MPSTKVIRKQKTPKRMEERSCPTCNGSFIVIHYSPKKFCSRRCVHLGERGENASNWQGGIKLHKGYRFIYAPDHPNRIRMGVTGYVKEHRLVMEKHIRRYLLRAEVVHHKNRDKLDNRIENLILFANHSDHMLACNHNLP